MTIRLCYTIVSSYRLYPFPILQCSKESNVKDVMKNINVQREVEYRPKYEKIEDLCPHVCTSVRERSPVFCLIVSTGTWYCWMIILNTMFYLSCSCFRSRNQSDSGDSGRRNVVSSIVPQSSSSDSLNLSCDDSGELCSECSVADWILGCDYTGRGCCSSTSASSSASSSSGSSW